MKLVRFGSAGAEKPGFIDAQGRIRDLSAVCADIDPAFFADGTCARLIADGPPDDAPVVPAGTRLGPPVGMASKIVGIGLNYREGARRAGVAPPVEPMVFLKSTTSLGGPDDPIVLPPGSTKTDWEVELALVIGRRLYGATRAEAAAAIAGYSVFNDLSERVWQNERGGEWTKGKSFDGFGPMGPWLVTAESVPDPRKLAIWLDLNGARIQDSNTDDMIRGPVELVDYVAQCMTLLPGDILITGTPAGTGHRQTPQRFLRPGDRLRLGIDGLGEQNAVVVAG